MIAGKAIVSCPCDWISNFLVCHRTSHRLQVLGLPRKKMVLHEEGDMIGPGWVMRDISEIKQGSFGSRKSRETTYDPLKEMAASDPKYKYYKRLMPKPRY